MKRLLSMIVLVFLILIVSACETDLTVSRTTSTDTETITSNTETTPTNTETTTTTTLSSTFPLSTTTTTTQSTTYTPSTTSTTTQSTTHLPTTTITITQSTTQITTTTTTAFVASLSSYRSLAQAFNREEVFGLDYIMRQTLDGYVMMEVHTVVEIVSKSSLLAKETIALRRVNPLPAETEYDEKIDTYYYYPTRTVHVSETETKEIDRPLDSMNLILGIVAFFEEEYILRYQVDETSITIEIKNEVTKQLLQIDNIQDLIIRIEQLDGKIVSLHIEYVIDGYDFEMDMQFSYIPFDESIMNIPN